MSTHSISADEYARVVAKIHEPDLDWDNPSEYDLLDRNDLTDTAEKILAALKWAGFSVQRLDDLALDEFELATLPTGDDREPSDAALIDLWWTTCDDVWAIPDELMVKFGRAAIAAARRPSEPVTVTDAQVEAAWTELNAHGVAATLKTGGKRERDIVRAALEAALAVAPKGVNSGLCDAPCPHDPSAGGCWLSEGHEGEHLIDGGTYRWPAVTPDSEGNPQPHNSGKTLDRDEWHAVYGDGPITGCKDACCKGRKPS